MCGRFTLAADPSELGDEFRGVQFPPEIVPRYNISPSQPVLAIRNDGKQQAGFLVWGLVPSWAKDPSIGSRLINARGETLAEKPAFRGAYKYKRCLIPADGFYEWKAAPGTKTKTPYAIRMKTGRPFAFAGLWDEWHSPDGSVVYSCTIITTGPNDLMAPIHNRMPVILQRQDYGQWLDRSLRPAASLSAFVRPFPAELLDAYPVSTLVNSPANDSPECIQPA
jgi:putative SOS response-associated peptidase YedK